MVIYHSAVTVLCFVPLKECPKVCKLCNLASVLFSYFSKEKEMSTSVSCHHLAASVFGVTIAKLRSSQRFRARKSK